jgi:hypothetical protein
MRIKKSYFLQNFIMFCLGATVGRRIGDLYEMRHLAAKSADSMLMNLPHYGLYTVIRGLSYPKGKLIGQAKPDI